MHRLADTAAAEFVYLENRFIGRGDARSRIRRMRVSSRWIRSRRCALVSMIQPISSASRGVYG
jgi:hypothetical protein